ncbi:MAG: tetratricopeptide repeat protein [Candidatus Tectomicrobia bacterium]|uniref:Tetratricopeptide repeat protein n=1 Tax=Tectimicrobiota bacterium TaxID=2528274 RepID=A0A933GKB3_UNCTE|nr:tetratricopeptide repeat protein [Candidatus Tectomicrobia bacterium]
MVTDYAGQIILRGFWDEGLYLHNIILEEKDRIEKRLLGRAYNNIGGIYDNKGEWDKALEYYLKSEKITIEVGDRAGLVSTCFNIGILCRENGDKKGKNYIILAGYLSIMLGMRHEFSQMQWALGPIIKEIGEEKFIKLGQRLSESKKLKI